MSGSFAKIDYQLRPAKTVERKMMAEIFCRLSVFAPLDQYRYVGLGSVYFSDFFIFHAACGFGSMVSIENTEDSRIKKRCHFNVPVSSIELFFQPTTTVFPKLDWTQRSVVWLDYDDPLTSDVLSDAGYVVGQLKPGSVLAVSCNTERTRLVRDRANLVERLKNDIGPDSIPNEASEQEQVDQGHFNKVIRAALTARVQKAIADRNAGKEAVEKVAIEQIFYYTYEDDAPMLTLGWLIRDAEDHSRLELARLGSIYHARSGVRPFHIKIPKLTPAEMRAINRLDSNEWYEKEKSLPLLKEEIDLFRQVKRYWPMARFMELV